MEGTCRDYAIEIIPYFRMRYREKVTVEEIVGIRCLESHSLNSLKLGWSLSVSKRVVIPSILIDSGLKE